MMEPRTETEWSRRAIINVVDVLGPHAEALTLIGGHAILIRTIDLDIEVLPTSDGDLAVTPSLVASDPRIEDALRGAGYESRTNARPGLWGRVPYVDAQGTRQFREKIDLSTGRALSGTDNPEKRSVPALARSHGKMAVNNASGLELASFDRAIERVVDIADKARFCDVYVASGPALLIAKSYKVAERLDDPRRGGVRDKDLGDVWRLMAATDVDAAVGVFAGSADHAEIGASVRVGVAHVVQIASDPACREMARRAFGPFVDPRRIDDDMDRWLEALRTM